MKDLEAALIAYAEVGGVPELAQYIRGMRSVSAYVKSLTKDQLSGKQPLFGIYRPPKDGEVSGLDLKLYWKSSSLHVQWPEDLSDFAV